MRSLKKPAYVVLAVMISNAVLFGNINLINVATTNQLTVQVKVRPELSAGNNVVPQKSAVNGQTRFGASKK